MAINLASKYEKKVAERYSIQSVTDSFAGKDYNFTGVQTINIYTVDSVPLTDYTRSGSNRFGPLNELGDTIQEMTLTKDRSFTFTIDAGNAAQQFNIKQANQRLKKQIDEVVTPEVDKYRIAAWADGAGTTATIAALTKTNILETILTGSMTLNNFLVPKKGRALFIAESAFLTCKLADQIVGIDKLGEKAIVNGSVGVLDNMQVVPVPDSYLPTDVKFLIKHKGTSVDPIQLRTYRVLKEVQGIDGDVVEGRIIYDAFVLGTKKNGIYVATL